LKDADTNLYIDDDNDPALTDLEKSERKVAKLQRELAKKDEQIAGIIELNKKLQKQLVEAEETLAEWDRYGIQTKNKENALKEFVKTSSEKEKYLQHKEKTKNMFQLNLDSLSDILIDDELQYPTGKEEKKKDKRRPSATLNFPEGFKNNDMSFLASPKLLGVGLMYSPDFGWTRSRLTQRESDDLTMRTKSVENSKDKTQNSDNELLSGMEDRNSTLPV